MPDAIPNQQATGTGQLATDSTGAPIQYGAAPQGTMPNIPPPNTSAPVLSSTITNGSPLNLPQATPTDNGTNLIASTIAGNTPPPTPTSSTSATDTATQDPVQAAQAQYNQGVTDYKTAANGMLGQGAALTAAENANGVPDVLNKLTTINTQIAEKTAAFNNAYQSAETGGIQSGTPAVFYQGQQAAIQRQQAVVIGGLSAVKAALQGNYQLAESRAQQVVKTQFADQQQKLTNAENFLKLNTDNLNNQEKIAAAKIKANLTVQKQQLTSQMANRKFALSNGVTSEFYTKPDGTVVRTEDGKAYSTPQQAFADGVLPDFSNAPRVTGVGKSETKTINGRLVHITYDSSNQNVISQTDLGKAGNQKAPSINSPQALKDATNAIDGFLQTGKGKYLGKGTDGYYDPATYNAARQAWIADGHNVSIFDSKFSKGINPANAKSYNGVKPKAPKAKNSIPVSMGNYSPKT